MDREWLYICDRLNEVSRLCGREHPIYEHVSNYSLALYIIGFFKSPDIMTVDDLDEVDAGSILKEYFIPIEQAAIASDYNIKKSKEKYLLVIGDPVFPTHFAVLIDRHRLQPFFSKLKIYGTGYDSLAELEDEFVGWEGIGRDDFNFYKMKQSEEPQRVSVSTKSAAGQNDQLSAWDYEEINHYGKIVEVVGK